MRINSINTAYRSALLCRRREICGSYNFKNSCDSVSFTSSQIQTNMPSKAFNRLVEDEDLKKEIIKEIIIDPDGRYRRDVEENFEQCYEKIQEKEEESLDKNTLLKAMLFVFKTVKPKDNYSIKSAEFKDFILASYEAIIRKDDLEELYESCKNRDGEPNI